MPLLGAMLTGVLRVPNWIRNLMDTLGIKEDKANKGVPDGYAPLDAEEKIPLQVLPEPFPVGSLFFAIVDTNPNALLGYGTWLQIAQGQFIVGQKSSDPDFDVAEKTGGAKTHTHTAHSALAHSGGAVGSIVASGLAANKMGTSAANSEPSGHTHPAPSFTQPSQHAAQSHDSPSHLPPWFTAYVWKRTA